MKDKRTVSLQLAAIMLILFLAGCAAARQPQLLAPDFRDVGIRSIHLPPVSFDPRYEPYDIDVDGELRRQLRSALISKGYQVDPSSAGEGNSDATLLVHVDFLFISETFSDRDPPPVIDIEAVARLVSTRDSRELWRDRGGGRVGGAGGSRIFYPHTSRQLAISLLVDNLLSTLPNAAGRQAAVQGSLPICKEKSSPVPATSRRTPRNPFQPKYL